MSIPTVFFIVSCEVTLAYGEYITYDGMPLYVVTLVNTLLYCYQFGCHGNISRQPELRL